MTTSMPNPCSSSKIETPDFRFELNEAYEKQLVFVFSLPLFPVAPPVSWQEFSMV